MCMYLIYYILLLLHIRGKLQYKRTNNCETRCERSEFESEHFSIVATNRIYFHCMLSIHLTIPYFDHFTPSAKLLVVLFVSFCYIHFLAKTYFTLALLAMDNHSETFTFTLCWVEYIFFICLTKKDNTFRFVLPLSTTTSVFYNVMFVS